ncbi:MAG: hypothetical protein AAB502_06595, partial [Chloroflexota bacterium]
MASERHIPSRLLALVACGILIAASACAPAAPAPSPGAPAQAPAQRPAAAPTPAAPPTPTALAPRSGGTFIILQGGNPPNFDTAATQNGLIQVAASPAYSKLVQFDPGAGKEIVPDLAEKWDVSADG